MRRVLVPLLCGLLAATACSPSDKPDTEALWRDANKAVQAEDWTTAAADFKKLTELDPQDGDAWHMLGFALHSAGKPVSADTPDVSGPRQCGQSSACTTAVTATTRASAGIRRRVRMGSS